MAKRNLTAFIYQEESLYVAECIEVGTVSQGYSIRDREALANLEEATELYLEEVELPKLRQANVDSETFLENL